MKKIAISISEKDFTRINNYCVEFLGSGLPDLAQMIFNDYCLKCESQISNIEKFLSSAEN